MSETLTEAATYIEQGHVRVGPHAVTDPAVSQPGNSLACMCMAGKYVRFAGHSICCVWLLHPTLQDTGR